MEFTAEEKNVIGGVLDKFGDAIMGQYRLDDQISIVVSADTFPEIARYLKEEAGFKLLVDICGVDWIDNPEKRFELVYTFYNLDANFRLLVRTFLPDSDKPSIMSIQPVYSGANWIEREVYDMLGIEFEGHPDLRRIITPDGLEGWPHRKDFPLTYERPQFSWNKDLPPEIIK